MNKKFNNKGFTLMELIATLVILSIIMSIGSFSVINIIRSAKRENYEFLIKNITSAAENFYQECKYSSNDGLKKSDGTFICDKSGNYTTTIGILVNYGYLKGNDKEDGTDNFTIVNPITNKSIGGCGINISYDNSTKKVKVISTTGDPNPVTDCPTTYEYQNVKISPNRKL